MMRGISTLFLALRAVLTVVAAVMFFSVSAQAAPPAVDKVRVQTHPGFTRVLLETNAPIEPHLFTRGLPHRLIIDLPELQWRIPKPSGYVHSPLVRKYSFGLFQPGVSRLVLNLSGPTKVLGRKLSRTAGGYLYQIDLAYLPAAQPNEHAATRHASIEHLGLPGLPVAPMVAPATKSVFESRSFDPAKAEFDALSIIAVEALGKKPAADPIGDAIKTASLESEAIPALAPEKSEEPEKTPEEIEPETVSEEVVDEIKKMTPEAPKRPPLRVVLDPGHGGRDPGTGADSGVYEKDVNLAFAKVLADLLNADPNYVVFLTRETDTRVRLPKRVQFARRKNADLFISIHADWSINKRAKGATAYTLSEEASVEALDSISSKRAEVGEVAGVDLAAERADVARLLVDLARRDTQARSLKFAELVVAEVAKETPVLRRPLRRDSFHVLKAPDMPSVLLELGFLSNETDRERLQSVTWRLKTAEAVKRAVDEFRSATGKRVFGGQ